MSELGLFSNMIWGALLLDIVHMKHTVVVRVVHVSYSQLFVLLATWDLMVNIYGGDV